MALFLSAALLPAGCITSTAKLAVPVNKPDGFSKAGNRRVPDRWWREFGERELNALVDEALASELTLKIAWERFRESRAIVARESSFLFPEVEGFASARRVDTSSGDNDRLDLGLSSFYEVDLWGRIQASVEAERFRAEADFADYQAAALSLSAEVARAWVQLMEANARLDLLEEQIEANEKLVRQLRNQFAGGQTRSVDVLRQRQLLSATREQKHEAEAAIRVLEHRLAVLTGRPAQDGLQYRAQGLPAVPPLPATGLPVELVQRRPDIQRAFFELKAADREVAVAISEQFPRLTLTASVRTGESATEQLFDNWVRSFAADLVAPLFEAGRRRAEVYRADAVEKQRLFEYGQRILVAFEEVENALIREKKQRDQIRELEEQVRLAEDAYEQLFVEHINGVSDFIDYLTSLTDKQQLRRDLLVARRLLLEFRIDLYLALAGGIEPARPK